MDKEKYERSESLPKKNNYSQQDFNKKIDAFGG